MGLRVIFFLSTKDLGSQRCQRCWDDPNTQLWTEKMPLWRFRNPWKFGWFFNDFTQKSSQKEIESTFPATIKNGPSQERKPVFQYIHFLGANLLLVDTGGYQVIKLGFPFKVKYVEIKTDFWDFYSLKKNKHGKITYFSGTNGSLQEDLFSLSKRWGHFRL